MLLNTCPEKKFDKNATIPYHGVLTLSLGKPKLFFTVYPDHTLAFHFFSFFILSLFSPQVWEIEIVFSLSPFFRIGDVNARGRLREMGERENCLENRPVPLPLLSSFSSSAAALGNKGTFLV